MADEVPIPDVLCEAMEYLCKLGSNLRTRSETLREKKIRKDKLRNTHAVQKAASKVLLICELAKKSLENVETGVKKVLSRVDTYGGKSSDNKVENKPKGFFIEYKSRRLRIAQKVYLKHYTSVKVTARSMPVSMQDRYPVYYNSKLYRQRKRASLKQHSRRNSSSSSGSKNIKDENSHTDTKRDSKKHIDDTDDEATSNTEGTSCGIKQTTAETSSNDDNHSMEPASTEGNKELSVPHKDAEKSLVEISDDDISMTETKGDTTKIKSTDHKHSRKKKVRFVVSSDEDSDSQKPKENPKRSSSPEVMVNDKNDASDKPTPVNEKLIDSDQDSIKTDSDNKDSKKSDCDEENTDSKPLIRCVNISKLLKPDVLPKDKEKLSKTSNSHKHSSIDRKRRDSEEYWKEKRNEVKQFKSKDFTIQVKRLPDLCETFLVSHKLKKITKNGNVVCEVGCENVECTESSETNKDSSSKKEKQVKTDTKCKEKKNDDLDNKITKESLLNDSDSETEKQNLSEKNDKTSSNDSRNNKKNKTRKRISTVVLNDSDSDSNEKLDKDKDATQEVIKKSLLNDSDSEGNKDSNDKPTQEGIKESLLNESDSDTNNADKTQKKYEKSKKVLTNDSDDKQTQEGIKESLLNDSDSDKSNSDKTQKNNDKTKKDLSNDSDKQTQEGIKESLLNDSDSDKSNPDKTQKNPNKTKQKVLSNGSDSDKQTQEGIKASLLNDSDSDKNSDDSTKKDTAKTKQALLHYSDSDDNSNKDTSIEKVTDEIIDALVNVAKESEATEADAGEEVEFEPQEELNMQSAVDDLIKKSLLNDSDSDNNDKQNDSTKDESDKINTEQEKPKENTDNQEQDSPSKDVSPSKVKKSLLNDSSSQSGDDSSPTKKKVKLSKSKRDLAKKNIRYSSSSDESNKSDEGKKSKSRRRSRRSSSSSDNNKKKRKKRQLSSDDEDDRKSKSRSKKMVRSKSKPSGSSGQNSDNQDAIEKDIDGLTNLNSLNKKPRRHESSNIRKSSRPKKTPNIGEDLLQPECSDSSDNNDQDIEEDLPPINMSGFNGDSVDHLAKDDLLVESDSSGSKENEDTPATNESEEEENVKSTRRKANAISSDSEGGTSKRQNRVSDFEDSAEESSEGVKRSKRKKETDSDASVGSGDGTKKKRRRIKQLASDESGSDSENEGRNKHGRKNIRKVMGKNQLEEATKKAAREEKERIARISERQKLYNNLEFDESGKPDEVVLDKVILDFDPETKEPLIQVDRGLVKKLKPHQANGIKFMWDACFESVKRIKKDKGSGCILAHCMGLGKTLQVISLTHTLLIHGPLTKVNRVLVVCPLSTVLNWVNEIKMWLKHAISDFEVDVYELSRYKQNSERAYQLQQWFDGGGVCVLGYEMFRNLSADNNKKFKKKMLRSFQESLVDPGPDLVVCDEGHLLKNEKTSLSQSMNRIKSLRRIVLTGTPLQNNLKEYYCMVQFVKPNLLGKYNEYLNRFVNPITNGQYTDSTEHDIKVMKRRSHVLHKMLDGAVQRRDYGVLAPFLPPKHEYVLFITLSEVQIKLYQYYLDNYSRRPMPGKSSGFLFPDFQSLQRIWTHPLVLKYNSERYEIMQQKKREREEEEDSEGSLVDFIDDDSTPDESSTEESSDDSSDMSDSSRKKSKKKKSAKKSKKESKISTRRGTRANPAEIEDDVPEVSEVVEVKNENPTEWWIKLVEDEVLDDMRNSHKLVLLFDILRQCEAIGDKLLVFSQSLYSLDLIEHFLGKVDEATQEGRIDEKLGGHVGSWSPGVDYFRLDGSTSCENRSIWCKNFNRVDNPRARLFLISTRAGGLGINLVAANRVVIFDVSWNPSHDVQSIFRVYRFGQKKPCYVYRFLAMGTMEEKIYERQVTKQAISKRVIDEQQIDRHYAENDLAELYKFEARPEAPREIPALPKDRLFAEMLKDHEQQIYKYHEHDSLLENKEEETLSEEERKAAWDDFENEKTRPPPAAFPSWPMHNGMMPNLIAQQHQQLTYAALAAVLRKDMPNLTDNQIRDMLPILYNSNPGMFGGYDYGLMSKMAEIYKYAQPGMMNPSMMNPAMNSGASAAMGGSSGLQYEPPWQRQHQQQQQMRLQQLLQQQQNMGAKFYSGGLGSRDPVAMALQQQRAREIMLGGASRPRGRPPAPARPPPPGDIVNLDSD